MGNPMMEVLRGNWQEGKTLPQCNLFLMECGYGDITFRVYYKNEQGKEEVADIPAIRIMCIARSPVFFAMLAGELAQQQDKPIHEIRDELVDPDAFRSMIRFMYSDDVTLTADNVLAVLYLAQKYIVSTLITRCLHFLEKNLTAHTAPVLLDQSLIYGEKELKEKTLATIEKEAPVVLTSEEFADLSHQALGEVLKLKLRVEKEVTVFGACVKWAEKRCHKLQKDASGENIREVLGENLFQIRFPAMSLSDFTEVVAPRDVLTGDEGFQVYRYITSASHKPEHLPFQSKPRFDVTPRSLFAPAPYDIRSITVPNSNQYETHTTRLICSLSNPLRVRKILVSALGWPKCVQTILKVTIKQNGASLHEYTGDPATITHRQLRPHFVADMEGVLVKSGVMELYIELKRRGIHTDPYTTEYTSRTITQLSDSFVTIKFPGTRHNLLRGIEYSTV